MAALKEGLTLKFVLPEQGVMDVEVQFEGMGTIAGPPARGREVGMAVARGVRRSSMEVMESMMSEVVFVIENFEI